MPLSRPFPKIFINFYIFLSFWKSHSMDLIRNLFLSHCLQKCFLVTSLISTLTASILISFLSFLRRKTKNFFSSGMMMARSIVRGDCPCIFQPLSSETVVSSVSPLLLRYTPQCYGARQGRSFKYLR